MCSTSTRPTASPLARETGYQLQLAEIKESLEKFNVHFDVWFSERSLKEIDPATGRNAIDDAVERLRAQGHVFEQDGAVWVRTTDFSDDKDRVIRRANGIRTYFASDAAYYLNKGDRGFAHKIYLLGADHHGYVNRLKALAGAAGDDPERDIEVLIGQLVSINGARLSKRAGNVIELNDLQAWLGTDALRYSLGRYPADSPLTLDPELLQKRTNDNPVFYVQYAHARTHQVAKNAAARAWTAAPSRPRRSRTRPKANCSACWGSSRASSPRRPSCVSRTGSPATWRNSPAPTTAGTTTAASRRSATNPSPTCTAPACGSTTPPARCCATASACSG